MRNHYFYGVPREAINRNYCIEIESFPCQYVCVGDIEARTQVLSYNCNVTFRENFQTAYN
jgi:hypothetical protein